MPKLYSAALVGLSAELVEIEVDVSAGLPMTVIVGLPDTSVQEARERVRAAIRNSNAIYPRSRVAVNLAPADLPKIGSHYDLPIAISILLNSEQINFPSEDVVIIGEVALHGGVRPVAGVLPVILMAKAKGFKRVVIPKANTPEATLVTGIDIIPVDSLIETVSYLQGTIKIPPVQSIDWDKALNQSHPAFDFKLIHGHEAVKRAMEVAAAGAHNILLSGSPGTGKTLLAKAFPSILPKLSMEEALEVTKIYSIAGYLSNGRSFISSRPYRSPHHSASGVSLVGGGSLPKPGEISLAHRGVLFLDELPEFPRNVLENLRQPLEDGVVTVSRASGSIIFPAQFILIAAQNPCPCGYYNTGMDCSCTFMQIMNYQRKVSGPLLDRIDIFAEVEKIEYEKLSSDDASEHSELVQKRVQAARDLQTKRFTGLKMLTNSEMGIKEIRQFCKLGVIEKEFIKKAALKLNLSARSYHRILKLARTIADLEGSLEIKTNHLGEAIQYRTKSEQ